MASRTCWACERYSHMTLRSGASVHPTNEAASNFRLSAMFECDACKHPSLGMTIIPNPHRVLDWDAVVSARDDFVWVPAQGQVREFPDVPEHIATAASEAYQCESINAHRGAVAIARAVVEATAKDKGITSGRLVEKIDQMHARGLIREHIKDGAHEVRHLGNDVAHGDFVDPVSKEDADLTLTLMAEVLDEVFQSPARVEKARQARLTRKQGT